LILVKHVFQAFWVALQFLTLLPIPLLKGMVWDERAPVRAVYAYPFVGVLIGIILYGVQAVLPQSYLWVNGLIITLIWAWLTGGLHLDGVADAADGWMGGLGSKTRTFDIMKDPHIGVTGVITLMSLVILKIALVGVLLIEDAALWLIVIPVLARSCAVVLMANTPYVSEKGIATGWANQVGLSHVVWALVVAVLITLLVVGSWGVFVTLAITVLGLRYMMMRRLNGCTGDTIGATIEFTELAALFYVYASIG
jgi:adenosylcobinamide-GDP ribazoletransferase